MCRFAAYLGPSLRLADLLYAPPHGLERQSYLPGEMVSGHVNVDGTGVAWWTDEDERPLRYASDLPPWSDPNLPGLARRLSGSPILAAVRSQTPGQPAGVAAAHPFTWEIWAGAHNGFLGGFDALKWELVELVAPPLRRHIDLLTDSLLLFYIALSRLLDGTAPTLAGAMGAAIAEAGAICCDRGHVASLNLVCARPGEVVAARAARGITANSLYRLENGRRWPGGMLLASEPLDDDGGWTEVAPDHVVRLSSEGVSVGPLAAC